MAGKPGIDHFGANVSSTSNRASEDKTSRKRSSLVLKRVPSLFKRVNSWLKRRNSNTMTTG